MLNIKYIENLVDNKEWDSVTSEHITFLIGKIKSLDELVYVNSIIKRSQIKLDKLQKNNLLSFSENQDFPFTNEGYNSDVKVVTLITPTYRGSHLNLVIAYAASIASIEHVKKVNIIYSGEWEYCSWNKSFGSPNLPKHYEKIKKSCGLKDYYKKISITLSPRADEIGELIGDVIFKFSGAGIINSNFLFAKKLYSIRPVIILPFSSLVIKQNYVSEVLSRKSDSKVSFIPPAQFQKINPPRELSPKKISLVTIYGANRIADGLNKLSKRDWEKVGELLTENKKLMWTFIGAINKEKVIDTIPKDFFKLFSNRIVIKGHSDIERELSEGFAFLTLPKVFGGGGGATTAIANGVPVLVVDESNSDISNNIPKIHRRSSFVSSIEMISLWLCDSEAYSDAIHNQQQFLSVRMNYEEKGAELFKVINPIIKSWNSRNVDNILVTKTWLPEVEKYKSYVDEIFKSGWVTNNGPMVRKLEKKLEDYLNVSNVILVSNGTIALEVAYRALGVTKKAITTPFSFVATTSSLVTNGIEPIFVDIDNETFNINPKKIEESITSDVSAIVPVHVFGNPCDVEKISQIADKNNLKVIYDAAHAFGVKYKDKSILTFGDISTVSFHATKLFHTIEGGALIVNDDSLVERIRYLINFGIKNQETISELGTNAKMSEFSAAMGLCVLDDIDGLILKRKSICSIYRSKLDNSLLFQFFSEFTEENAAYFPVLFKDEKTLIKVVTALNSRNIYPRRYFYPSLDTLPYLNDAKKCPYSRDVSSRILCLPVYPELSLDHVELITQLINNEIKE